MTWVGAISNGGKSGRNQRTVEGEGREMSSGGSDTAIRGEERGRAAPLSTGCQLETSQPASPLPPPPPHA